MRRATVVRRTKETSVLVELTLEGKGKALLKVDDSYAKHMLNTLARYAQFDLRVQATGDLDHHLQEDIALALGRALREALGAKPVNRLGHAVVPMDEALVRAAVDLIDRPHAEIDLPKESAFAHFLRSFATAGEFTLHVQTIRGGNEHHVAEAAFKALGLALRHAVGTDRPIGSTKGAVEWEVS